MLYPQRITNNTRQIIFDSVATFFDSAKQWLYTVSVSTLIIRNTSLLITMDDERNEIINGGMIIRNGFIETVSPTSELPPVDGQEIDLEGHIVLPGLVNTHHHFDHDVDYPCFLLCRWDQSIGKENILKVFGPTLTEKITQDIIGEGGVFSHDWKARINAPVSQTVYVNRGGTLPRKPPDVFAKDVIAGKVFSGDTWEVTAANAESKIITFEYFQTKSQKRGSQVKLASIASKIGNDKLTKIVKDKVILKSQVTMGSGNINDLLQKLETGELELEGTPIYIENGDGTVTVKMIVKPR